MNCWARCRFSAMSRSAPCGGLGAMSERIQGVCCGGLSQIKLQRIPVDHIDPPRKQARDILFDPRVCEQIDRSLRIQLDQDVDIAVDASSAAGNGAEERG